MRAFLAVCANDLRQRMRDRTILLLGLLGPFVVASVVGLAFGSGAKINAAIVVADLDHSEQSQQLAAVFRQEGGLGEIVDLKEVDTEDAARDEVSAHSAGAAVVVPAGFGAAVASRQNTPVTLTVLVDPASTIEASVAEGVVRQYLGGIATVRLAYATAASTGATAAELESLPPPDPRDPLELETESVFQLSAVDYFAPAMGLMFLYFTVLFGAATFVREERTHTLSRLAVSPSRSVDIIGGKLAALFVIGLIEMAVLIAATSIVFDVPWGSLPPLAALVVTTVLSAIGLTALVSAVSRTEEQARSIGSAVILSLALFGGQFFMTAGAPQVFLDIQAATPTGAALIGFTDLMIAGGSATFATVWWPLLYTGLFGLATAAIGAALFERRMHR